MHNVKQPDSKLKPAAPTIPALRKPDNGDCTDMPIYEYRCSSCGHELEKLQRMSDEPLRDCPDCGRPELRRLISAAGFRLKGSGWYETDFKSGNRRNLRSEEHTSELQSRGHLVCRLLLEKQKPSAQSRVA